MNDGEKMDDADWFGLAETRVERPMPQDVQKRLQARVNRRAAGPGPHNGRWVAVALSAAVVTAVAGLATLATLVSAQWSDNNATTSLAASGGWTQAEIEAAGKRFWTPTELFDASFGTAPAEAVQRCSVYSGAESKDWEPILTASARGVMVVAFAAGDERIFCELTPATVTVYPAMSADSPEDHNGPGTVLFTRLGTVAGLVPEPASQVLVSGSGKADASDAAVVHDGVFVRPNSLAGNTSRVWVDVDGSAQHPVGVSADPAAALRDAADQPGSQQEQLGDCLRSSDLPVADAGDWSAGASGQLGDTPIRVWRYGSLMAVCAADGGAGRTHVHVVDENRPGTTGEPALAASKDLGASEELFYDFGAYAGGEASDTVAIVAVRLPEGAASVELTRSLSDRVLKAPVVNDTFLLTGVDLNAGGTGKDPSTLTIRDAHGDGLATIHLPDL